MRPKVCIDRVLPRNLWRRQERLLDGPSSFRAITPLNTQWPNGARISIAFIGGTSAQRAFVREHAERWLPFGNFTFDWRTSLPADVRIAFDEDDGSWSYVGVDCLEIPSPAPTMNIGWQDESVVEHEFGHMLALAHEHQSPFGGIQWDIEAVVADLSGPPNYWSRAEIMSNVIEKYAVSQVRGTVFDPMSVMLYAIPRHWTLNGFSSNWNTHISVQDGAWIGSESMYPPTVEPPILTPLPIYPAAVAAIAKRGDLLERTIVVGKAGIHVIETGGATDVVLRLYRDGTLLQANDDSGHSRNARIVRYLEPGTYRVTVQHYSRSGTGDFSLVAWSA